MLLSEEGRGKIGRERKAVREGMPVAVADPLRWWGAGLATHSALSYCNRREGNIQILL